MQGDIIRGLAIRVSGPCATPAYERVTLARCTIRVAADSAGIWFRGCTIHTDCTFDLGLLAFVAEDCTFVPPGTPDAEVGLYRQAPALRDGCVG